VDQRNVAARNLYGKLGFTAHCEFIEGISVKRHADPRSRTVQSRSTRSNKP
jgi:hypothetical protein